MPRTWLPQVEPVAIFADVAGLPGAALADLDGGRPSLDRPTVLVGPEGGWSPGELGAGWPTLPTRDSRFRAETAAITSGCAFELLYAKIWWVTFSKQTPV